MIDVKILRENPKRVSENILKRGLDIDVDKILDIDKKYRLKVKEIEDLKAKENKASKEIAKLSGEAKEKAIASIKAISDKIDAEEPKLKEMKKSLDGKLMLLPNFLLDSVPEGKDESKNKIFREWGEKPKFDFKPKEHFILGKKLNVIDAETAAKVSGSRFYYLKGALVQMEFAIVQLVLSVLTDVKTLEKIAKDADLDVASKPFVPVIPPVLIKPAVMQKMARLEPRDERYYASKDDLYLVGSAEHTLGPLHMDEILSESDLPIRYLGFSTSFRRESGSYGKDVKGILRVHQFDKLEMESFSLKENSEKEQDFCVAIQEYLMQQLKIPYRVVAICSGDMGDPDARQIDIEAWLPGQNKYRETHSSDLMTDYQARRLKTRVKRKGQLEFVHMNDATAFAIGRTLIAIMENCQQKDGSIKVPEVLAQISGVKEIK